MGCAGSDEHNGVNLGREKKLLAGIRFSLLISGDSGGDWDCRRCDERKREQRNCRNRWQLKHTLLQGGDEWRLVSRQLRHVLKVEDLKFFECPISVITGKSWQILRLVNETTSGEHCDILHLPFPGGVLDQPIWYREAVSIVRAERARHQRQGMERMKKD